MSNAEHAKVASGGSECTRGVVTKWVEVTLVDAEAVRGAGEVSNGVANGLLLLCVRSVSTAWSARFRERVSAERKRYIIQAL